MSKMIIFTDLDGTLLNHKSYDYKAVLPLLERLKSLDIPVVLNSSKTLSELDEWKLKLKLSTPVIAENGGVMTVPSLSKKGEEKILIGRPYEEIRSFIKHLRKRHGWQFEGFGDWTLSGVMNHTGLHSKEALLATEREVTEPILWQDSEANLEAFKAALEKENLTLKKGGRFYHVMGHHDKADAMHFLVNKEYFSDNKDCVIVALGDSDNDIAMLNYADVPIVICNPSGKGLNIQNAIYTDSEAPFGWVEAIEKVLETPFDQFSRKLKGE
ncbi:Glucosyl-3-phosphoglycerate/mannosyl-3-phosphoglycerate phosphatase [Hydrogenovibrio crunogenus]|uniref:Glucosyl-3-phosphoglycerate/mannosyl-3-phosphoglycerate phosphatase n=2 Tax=Hydrogenovibrio crunogenus TaxID=39765 RepID=A0A4P7NYG1_9GAMM|nr:Glucosyl-3-phosphoglycerate/mannosyl-3-phosphoglycerate phosphatase [Hydrogenovibrio crunogenus]